MIRPLLLCLLLVLLPFGAQADVQHMEAVRYARYGSPDVLKVVKARAPELRRGFVRVQVHAAGVNTIDWKIRKGGTFTGFPYPPPLIPGYDFSGVIDAVGKDVEGFAVGDEVFGMLPLETPGAYAEYVAVDARAIARKPEGVSHTVAAALPMPALTASQALFGNAKLQAKQTVLIHGAAGGVGHIALQLAKASGAHVIATGSTGRQEFLLGLGADQFVDYTAQPFEQVVRDVDVVLDTVGGDTLARSYGVLKPGGILVSLVEPLDERELRRRGIRGEMILVAPSGKMLEVVARELTAGRLRVEIEQVFPLAAAATAHRRSETRRVQGRLVLSLLPDELSDAAGGASRP
ncbi:MAG: NADP-dependent oxidoreductase [Pseudomonadota bacterium]|jgi:NADPH:quinone reductase-like Zn-dependent oxidoreductase